jgi:vacuolar-type H+-ATPase subunit I/STV1
MTINDAAETLGVTVRTIQRRIQQDKMQSREDNGVRLVCVSLRQEGDTVDVQQLIDEKDARISDLLTQNDDLRSQVAELHQLLAISQKNINQITEQNHLLLEDLRPKQRWYHRLLTWNKGESNGLKAHAN